MANIFWQTQKVLTGESEPGELIWVRANRLTSNLNSLSEGPFRESTCDSEEFTVPCRAKDQLNQQNHFALAKNCASIFQVNGGRTVSDRLNWRHLPEKRLREQCIAILTLHDRRMTHLSMPANLKSTSPWT